MHNILVGESLCEKGEIYNDEGEINETDVLEVTFAVTSFSTNFMKRFLRMREALILL